MKAIDTIWMTCILGALIFQGQAQDKEPEQQEAVHIKVIVEEDGEKKVIEKVYTDMKSFKNDPYVKDLDLDLDMIEADVDIESKGPYRLIKVEMEKEMEEGTSVEETITIDGDDEKRIVIIQKDGSGEEQIMEFEGDDAAKWIDENGAIIKIDKKDFEFTDEDGKKMKFVIGHEISGDLSGKDGEIEKIIEIISDVSGDPDIEKDIEVEVTEDGEKKIEIVIRKTASLNMEISEINAGDSALSSVPFTISNSLSARELTYFPNPNSGKFTLQFALARSHPVTVRIYDITGRSVYEERLNEFDGKYLNEIDLKGEAKGVYVLQINQKNKGLSRKILIE